MNSLVKIVFLATPLLLSACQSKPVVRDDSQFLPFYDGNADVVAQTPLEELRALQLISTNLVSALIQIPEMRVGSTTLQVSSPRTAFGNTLIRALEEAGFGIQRVSADQGLNYVTYGKRFSETETGPITDYRVAVGDIEVRREYEINGGSVFPQSLMLVSGSNSIVDILLDDEIFAEQGGIGDSFISGVGSESISGPSTDIRTVTVNDYDTTPLDKRTTQVGVLNRARQRVYQEDSASKPVNLSDFAQMRRTVLIFDDQTSRVMGRGNKQAIRLLVREFKAGDIYSITACTDVDGANEAAQFRAIRVEEEFVSHGISASAVQIEPCIRASYRHSSDNSPVAVSVVQYRSINNFN